MTEEKRLEYVAEFRTLRRRLVRVGIDLADSKTLTAKLDKVKKAVDLLYKSLGGE